MVQASEGEGRKIRQEEALGLPASQEGALQQIPVGGEGEGRQEGVKETG